jgi:uncharacterized protein
MKILSAAVLFCFIPLLTLPGCGESLKQKASPGYLEEVNQWHERRQARLKEETGWLNLAGLFWLKEGNNTIGSARDNNIVFHSGPAYIGNLILKDSVVTLKVNDGVEVLSEGKPVKEMVLKDDHSGNTTYLKTGSLRWYVIKRTKGFAIRLRDLESPLLKEFKGIERFPVNEDWRIEAEFEEYNPPKKIIVPDITGVVDEELSPGAAKFIIDGIEYRLDAVDAGKRLWFIFADETSGEETYGAGRYLYADKPDSDSFVILDFNLAYNPPCVFTKYATCPFPPQQNYLKLRITAGEKMWNELHTGF